MPVTHKPALDEAIAALVRGTQRDPFAVLGPHVDAATGDTIVRAFQPAARSIAVSLVESNAAVPMERVNAAGIFEVRLKADPLQQSAVGSDVSRTAPDYRLRITYPGNQTVEHDDPYRYGRVLTDFDL